MSIHRTLIIIVATQCVMYDSIALRAMFPNQRAFENNNSWMRRIRVHSCRHKHVLSYQAEAEHANEYCSHPHESQLARSLSHTEPAEITLVT